jgi:CheY-like chemotaxis protein
MTTALIVDDSTVDRELVKTLLRDKTSLEVQFANDGADALRQISQTQPDIIITDLHMPHVNGLKLVESVQASYSTIPIVLITAHGSEDLAVQALKKGAASYVPKASLAKDLVQTVMHVLAVR